MQQGPFNVNRFFESAIVTGGASGLGLASVKALRGMGAKVAILDVNPEAGEAAAAETGAIFCEANVLSDDSLDAAFEKRARRMAKNAF